MAVFPRPQARNLWQANRALMRSVLVLLLVGILASCGSSSEQLHKLEAQSAAISSNLQRIEAVQTDLGSWFQQLTAYFHTRPMATETWDDIEAQGNALQRAVSQLAADTSLQVTKVSTTEVDTLLRMFIGLEAADLMLADTNEVTAEIRMVANDALLAEADSAAVEQFSQAMVQLTMLTEVLTLHKELNEKEQQLAKQRPW